MLRTSQDNQNVVLISKEQHSYKVLLKAIEPTEGETSPRKDIQLRPSNTLVTENARRFAGLRLPGTRSASCDQEHR